jgi:hypothetical protein
MFFGQYTAPPDPFRGWRSQFTQSVANRGYDFPSQCCIKRDLLTLSWPFKAPRLPINQ